MSSMFGGAQAGNAKAEADLVEIQTESLGFQAASGEAKLRLLPSPWPADSQPPPSASLLSVASSRGILASAGPDTLVIASTEKLRSTYLEGNAENNIKSFQPQSSIQIPRVNQVVFSSDENYLVIAAEQGGGLAVYETSALMSGATESAFQIPTHGVSVRQLVPNPNPSSDLAHYFAVVLDNGKLLLADFKQRQVIKNGGDDLVLQENVTCACWSRLGKQIVAGRTDGTAVQVDPQGNVKAQIPVPPQVPNIISNASGQIPVTSISWLETNDFLVVHSPPKAGEADGMADENSALHLARREKATATDWTFQTIVDPTPAFIQDGRTPAHHFIQRLRDWPPNLEDMVVILSTLSTDVGILTKTNSPLNPQQPVTQVFTTTMPDDTRRAAMPVSVVDDMSDTSAIGMALDMSTKEKIQRPIPLDEELAESPIPLPALYVLNHEGMLRMWWIINNDSIRQKQPYPDLAAAGGPRPLDAKQPNSRPATATTMPAPQATPTFGSSTAPSFGASPFAAAAASKPAGPSFGQTPTFGQTSAFGQAAASGTQAGFGGVSALGGRQSVWGTPAGGAPSPATQQPTFGSSTTIGGGSGFGQVGTMGQTKASPWGTQPTKNPSTSTSGAFGSFGQTSSTVSPFAAAAAAAAAKAGENNTSSFGTFGANAKSPLSFGSTTSSQNTFGGSSWQNVKAPGLSAEPSGSTVSFFGSGNNSGLSGTSSFGKPSVSREETMEDSDDASAKTTSGGLFDSSSPFKLQSSFKGDGTAKDDLPKPKDVGSGLFGFSLGNSLDSKDKGKAPSPQIKPEPGTETQPKLSDIPEVPTVAQQLAYKPKRFAGDLPPVDVPAEASSNAATKAETAEERDPKTYVAKRFAGDVPPADIPADTSKASKEPQVKEEPEAPLAGSPPIDLGAAKFSEAGSDDSGIPPAPEDDDDDLDEDDDEEGDSAEDGEEEEDDEDDEEGDEGEDEEDDEEEDGDDESVDEERVAAFMSRITPASPNTQVTEASTTPTSDKKGSYTPVGFPKAPVSFAPPSRLQESPRSPSPQRAVTSPVFVNRGPSTLSQSTQPKLPPPARPVAQPKRISVSPVRRVESPAQPPPPSEPDAGELEDEEDARVQAILQSRPEPTKDLPHFLAHQNYVGETSKPGVGGQIEKVFRDVNSMIDTLGLNAHSLQAFVTGHKELKASAGRGLDDLNDGNDWVFDEIKDLGALQASLHQELEHGKLSDVDVKSHALQEEGKEVTRLLSKASAMRKQISSRTDVEQAVLHHSAPLPLEAQMQQADLRKAASNVQDLLGKVEESLSLLRADLAAVGAANGTGKVPTVEAVTNTVRKMTAMIQQKSAEIDVLEAQIKRLPRGLPAAGKLSAGYEDDLITAMGGSKLVNGSPRSSPARSKRTAFNGDPLGMSGMFGSRFRTPPSGRRSVMFTPEANMLGRSTSSLTGSGRKKMNDVTDEEVEAYEVKSQGRKKVLEALRQSVEAKGVRVVDGAAVSS